MLEKYLNVIFLECDVSDILSLKWIIIRDVRKTQ